MNAQVNKAFEDILLSLKSARLWLFLGWYDIAKQYQRSFVGPIWLSISTGIFIGAFGFIWSEVFSIPISEYLPYVAAGHIVYTYINTMVIESSSVFINSEAFIKQIPSPKFIFPLRHVVRNFIIFLHNLVILVLVLWYFDLLININLLAFVIGILIISLNGVFVATYLGILATRFRDIPLVITNIMQVMFFVTPVLWKPEQISESAAFIVEYNPVAIFLIFARSPLLGVEVSDYYTHAALLITLANLIICLLAFIKFRKNIVFWL